MSCPHCRMMEWSQASDTFFHQEGNSSLAPHQQPYHVCLPEWCGARPVKVAYFKKVRMHKTNRCCSLEDILLLFVAFHELTPGRSASLQSSLQRRVDLCTERWKIFLHQSPRYQTCSIDSFLKSFGVIATVR